MKRSYTLEPPTSCFAAAIILFGACVGWAIMLIAAVRYISGLLD